MAFDTASNAAIYYEAASESQGNIAMTDGGDQTTFNTGVTEKFSAYESPDEGINYSPTVRANGVVEGCKITPGSSNDSVNISAGSINVNGVVVPITSKTNQAITRDASASNDVMASVCLKSGDTVEIRYGAPAASYVATRNADGGPALIPPDCVEVGQVKVDGGSAAVFATASILEIDNVGRETSYRPTFSIDHHTAAITFVTALTKGHAEVDSVATGGSATTLIDTTLGATYADDYFNGMDMLVQPGATGNWESRAVSDYVQSTQTFTVNSDTALQASDPYVISPIPKAVYVEYYTPVFAELEGCRDFVPPATTHTVTEETVYQGSETTVSPAKSTGSFTALDSVDSNSPLKQISNTKGWFKFKPNKDGTSKQEFIAWTAAPGSYPAEGFINATVTLTAITDVSRGYE